MFRSFDGGSGKRGRVSLGGATQEKRNAIDQARKAREERQARAAERAKTNAASKIQRVYRGFAARKRYFTQLRSNWDVEVQSAASRGEIMRSASTLTIFASPKNDALRMSATAKMLSELLRKAAAETKGDDHPIAMTTMHTLRRFATIVISKFQANPNFLEFLLDVLNPKLWSADEIDSIITSLSNAGVFKFVGVYRENTTAVSVITQLLESRNSEAYRLFAMELTAAPPLSASTPTATTTPTHAVQRTSPTTQTFTPPPTTSTTPPPPSPTSSMSHVAMLNSIEAYECLIDSLTQDLSKLEQLTSSTEHQGVWLLLNLIELGKRLKLSRMQHDSIANLVKICVALIPSVPRRYFLRKRSKLNQHGSNHDESDDDDDDDGGDYDIGKITAAEKVLFARWQGLEYIWTTEFVRTCLGVVSDNGSYGSKMVATLFGVLMRRCSSPFERANLLNVIAFKPKLLVDLWKLIQEQQHALQQFRDGQDINIDDVLSVLHVFAAAYSHLLITQDDSEFFAEDTLKATSGLAFTLADVIEISRQLKELAVAIFLGDASVFKTYKVVELRTELCTLLKQIYRRDNSQPFCPPGHFLSSRASSSSGSLTSITVVEFRTGVIDNSTRGEALAKLVHILKHLPFVIPFDIRAQILQMLINNDQADVPMSYGNFIQIRRSSLYADAFDKLNKLGPTLRAQIRVQMVNEQGMTEAGIDGGGVFREFLDSLIKVGFGLPQGLFCAAPDQRIFPHPRASVHHESSNAHFEFLGRMIGKAMYQGMRVELPLAIFFLSKLLGQLPMLNDLKSLDPEVHRNLLFLRDYKGDSSDLSLDFSVSKNESEELVDLIPNGRNIAVTNDNKIRYIYHVANYRLNIELRQQCAAFRRGLFDLINQEWLVMFSPQELQILISGKEADIDLDDLRRNTHYSGVFTDEHPTVNHFWNALNSFTKEQHHQFVMFVTSCSRPPLFGFAQLNPRFCIHSAGSDTRLPTASTCINLFKLPVFDDYDVLREKVLYAITSGAGFELS